MQRPKNALLSAADCSASYIKQNKLTPNGVTFNTAESDANQNAAASSDCQLRMIDLQ